MPKTDEDIIATTVALDSLLQLLGDSDIEEALTVARDDLELKRAEALSFIGVLVKLGRFELAWANGREEKRVIFRVKPVEGSPALEIHPDETSRIDLTNGAELIKELQEQLSTQAAIVLEAKRDPHPEERLEIAKIKREVSHLQFKSRGAARSEANFRAKADEAKVRNESYRERITELEAQIVEIERRLSR